MLTIAQWFPRASQAHQAVLDLLTSGVSQQAMGAVVSPRPEGTPAVEAGSPSAGGPPDGAAEESAHALAGALGGATTSELPGLGPVIAAGALGKALVGAASGTAGEGDLSELGLSNEEVGTCAGWLGSGGALVVVRAESAQATVVRGVFRHAANPGLSNPGETAGPEAGHAESGDQAAPPGTSVGALTGGMVPGGWGAAGTDLIGPRDDG